MVILSNLFTKSGEFMQFVDQYNASSTKTEEVSINTGATVSACAAMNLFTAAASDYSDAKKGA